MLAMHVLSQIRNFSQGILAMFTFTKFFMLKFAMYSCASFNTCFPIAFVITESQSLAFWIFTQCFLIKSIFSFYSIATQILWQFLGINSSIDIFKLIIFFSNERQHGVIFCKTSIWMWIINVACIGWYCWLIQVMLRICVTEEVGIFIGLVIAMVTIIPNFKVIFVCMFSQTCFTWCTIITSMTTGWVYPSYKYGQYDHSTDNLLHSCIYNHCTGIYT